MSNKGTATTVTFQVSYKLSVFVDTATLFLNRCLCVFPTFNYPAYFLVTFKYIDSKKKKRINFNLKKIKIKDIFFAKIKYVKDMHNDK